jgi:glycolate oxidase FAD binding subunit
MIRPDTPPQLAEALQSAASRHAAIHLGGNFSKDRLGGPIAAGEQISTAKLNRVLQYEPRDLTVSVEAGITFSDLERTLAEKGQMLPLDPGLVAGWEHTTIGGILGANLSGPRRRLYGTGRDMVIGMTFATLEGKLVQTGGMVVKNVAGLDMAKLMIGSFGTLAAIATVNFKVVPIPPMSRTFLMGFATAREAFAERDRILQNILPPAAIDIINWPKGYRLLVRATGNTEVISRFTKDLPRALSLEGEEEAALWREVRDFTARFLQDNPSGGVSNLSTPLASMYGEMQKRDLPMIARAGSGVIYLHHANQTPSTVIRDDSGIMKKIKQMFDPEQLLNRGRLHGYI